DLDPVHDHRDHVFDLPHPQQHFHVRKIAVIASEGDRRLIPRRTIHQRNEIVVPLVYGTAWYQPPITFARNDGNLTHMEVLLGMGQIENVVTVVVNGVEI